MRRDECVPFDSIWKPSSGKDCSISFSTETTAYFIKEHGNSVKRQMVQWFSDHSGKNEKRGIPLKVFQVFRKFSIGKARSIWFPTRKTGFSIQMESAHNPSFILREKQTNLVPRAFSTFQNGGQEKSLAKAELTAPLIGLFIRKGWLV